MSTREILAPESAEHIDFTFSGGATTNHRFSRDGALNTLPVHLSRVPMHIEAGDIPCDVALIQAAPDDGSGTLNLALSTDYMGAAIAKARTVIAEVNTRLPNSGNVSNQLIFSRNSTVHPISVTTGGRSFACVAFS